MQLARGLTTAQIAEKLHKSKRTIDGIRRDILQKSECRTTVGLLTRALEYGFLNDSLSLFVPEDRIRQASDYLSLAEGLVLHLILSDKNRSQIAKELNIEAKEVDMYRKRIKAKWGVDSPVDWVLKALQKGYVELLDERNPLNLDDKADLWMAVQQHRNSRKLTSYARIYRVEYNFPPYEEVKITPFQMHILRLRLEGKMDAEIAALCKTQEKNIPSYLHKIKRRLEVTTPAGLVKKAHRMGILKMIPGAYKHLVLMEETREFVLTYARSENIQDLGRLRSISVKEAELILDGLKQKLRVHSNEALLAQLLLQGEINIEML